MWLLLLGLTLLGLFFWATRAQKTPAWANWQATWQKTFPTELAQAQHLFHWLQQVAAPYLTAAEVTAFTQWLTALPPEQQLGLWRTLAAFCRQHRCQITWLLTPKFAPFNQTLIDAVVCYTLAIWRARTRQPFTPTRPAAPVVWRSDQAPAEVLLLHFVELNTAPSAQPDRYTLADPAASPTLGVMATLRQALLHYWRPHWGLGLGVAALLLLQQTYLTSFYFSLKFIIDAVVFAAGGTLLSNFLLALLGGLVLVVGVEIAHELIKARAASVILNDVRRQLFAQLQRLSANFYTHAAGGNVVARFTSDLAVLKQGLVDGVVELVEHGLGFGLGMVALFALQWQLALVLALTLGVGYWILTRWVAPRAYAAAYQLKRGEGHLAGLVQENVRGQPVVRAFGLQALMQTRFEHTLHAFAAPQTSALFWTQLMGMFGASLLISAEVFVVLIGALLILQGQMTLGTLTAFALLLATSGRHLQSILRHIVPDIIAAGSGLRRIEEVLRERPAVSEFPAALPLPRLSRAIQLEQVSFRYAPDQDPVLHNLSLAIPAGLFVGIVGPSGAGKTTLLHLLTRAYDVTAGRITLDGHDLRTVALPSLWGQIGVVAQETFLFDMSIRDNLRLARPNATDAEISAAAQAAEIHPLILALPNGYDTSVGEAGAFLSAGQRQRLAIARALLRDPALLLLDEATSALDANAEAALLTTLQRIRTGPGPVPRTIIFVTHRLPAVQHADHIFVLDQGQLLAQGTHPELLAQGGLYAQLWHAQQPNGYLPEPKPAAKQPRRKK